MYAATRACALPGVTWDGINWANVQRHVRGLQTRIVKATQDGRHNKVKALQWLLTHSFSGKALAVKRVTENVLRRKCSGVTGCRKMPLGGLSRVHRKTHARF